MDKLNKTLIAGAAALSFSAASVEACNEQTATVSSHVSAGRAEAVQNCNAWGFCSTSDHVTVGGGDSLGLYSFVTKTVHSTQTGVWNEGACPTGPTLSVNVGSVSEVQNAEGLFYSIAQGSITDPASSVEKVQVRFVGVNNWDDWKDVGIASDDSFNTSDLGEGPILAKGNYQLEVRPVLGTNQYGDVTSYSFSVANHAPICQFQSVRAERSEDLYGIQLGFWNGIDQDNNVDVNNFIEARIVETGRDWAQGEIFFGTFFVPLTDAAGELELGQTYTIEARVQDEDGEQTICDNHVFTAEDNLAPRITSTLQHPATVQIPVGGTFDPFAAENGLVAWDDYAPVEDITITFDGDVDTSTIGEYVASYTVSDNAGNSDSYFGVLNVVVVDTSLNNAPTIDSAYYTIIGESAQVAGSYDVGFTGSVSDVDGDFEAVYVNVVNGAGEETAYYCDNINDFNCTRRFEPGTYTFTIFAVDANNNRTDAQSEELIIGETGPTCIEATLADHTDAGRAYDQYFSYYATGTATYLGSTFNDANTVVALEEQTTDNWSKVTSCQ